MGPIPNTLPRKGEFYQMREEVGERDADRLERFGHERALGEARERVGLKVVDPRRRAVFEELVYLRVDRRIAAQDRDAHRGAPADGLDHHRLMKASHRLPRAALDLLAPVDKLILWHQEPGLAHLLLGHELVHREE